MDKMDSIQIKITRCAKPRPPQVKINQSIKTSL